MIKRLEATITGIVQGVMYRDFVQRKARSFSLVGFVRNNPDGSVTVVAEGEETALQNLEAALSKGPLLTRIKMRIEKVSVVYSEAHTEFDSFEIVYV